MRLALATYNPVKECQSCTIREEKEVSAHILAYQVAHQLFNSYSGSLNMDYNTLIVQLDFSEAPLTIDLHAGHLNYKSLSIPLQQHYESGRSLSEIVKEIQDYLALPEVSPTPDREYYTLLTKLIEIFHARCGLHFRTIETTEEKTTWEFSLCEQGPQGWISSDGIVSNRFGEVLNLRDWKHLRPEKLAAYVFGFSRFCRHFPSPIRESLVN